MAQPALSEHANATSGVVDGNPVHEENTRIARLCPPDLIVDVTLDEENRITGVFAGEMERAWQAGVAFAARHVRAPLPAPVDVVVTTCAGHPLDATFYQAVKGMVGALPIVKPGGSIVIAAACSEGIGGEAFTRTLLEADDLEAFTEAIQRPDWEFIPDQWEVEESWPQSGAGRTRSTVFATASRTTRSPGFSSRRPPRSRTPWPPRSPGTAPMPRSPPSPKGRTSSRMSRRGAGTTAFVETAGRRREPAAARSFSPGPR